MCVYINYHKLRLKGSSSLLVPVVFSTISMLHLWWISRDQKTISLSLSIAVKTGLLIDPGWFFPIWGNPVLKRCLPN